MRNTIRASMTWLHTWCGLLLGWLLYAIFVTGTSSYYKNEITQWTHPELRASSQSTIRTLELGYREVMRLVPDATSIYIRLPDARDPGLSIGWEDKTGAYKNKTVDAQTAKVEARDSRGGEFFYRFHFQLQLPYPWGRYIACLAAVFMLVALVTGIVAHRKFFKEFFTFRPRKPGTRSWLDFHNLAGVIALPFYFMIAYTALLIFIETVMPWARIASEPPAPAGTEQTERAGRRRDRDKAPSAEAAKLPLADWQPMAEQAEKIWGPGTLRYAYASGLGDSGGTVTLTSGTDDQISIGGRESLVFDASTGLRMEKPEEPRGIVTRVHDVLYGLHMVRFADVFLRGAFFILGLLGTALVGTGLVMWTVKRRPRQETLRGAGRYGFGHAIVERLNVAVVAGFPAALATFFWANRLLPLGLKGRGDWEVRTVFIVWALAAVHPWLRGVARAWREQLWTGAALFCLLPVVDALTGPYLRAAFLGGNRTYLGFTFTTFGLGLALAYTAFNIGRRRAAKAPHPEARA